jgi:hypothetical protein
MTSYFNLSASTSALKDENFSVESIERTFQRQKEYFPTRAVLFNRLDTVTGLSGVFGTSLSCYSVSMFDGCW